MKKLFKITLFLFVCCLSFCMFACAKEQSDDSDDNSSPSNVVETPEKISLDLFESQVLELEGAEGAVTWVSENIAIVTVDSTGLLQAVNVGQTTVSAVCGAIESKWTITVSDSGARPTISTANNQVVLHVDKTFDLNTTIDYLDGEIQGTISYDVEDNSIVEVSNEGVLTGKKVGETEIIVSATVNSYQLLPVKVSVSVVLDAEIVLSENTVQLYANPLGGDTEQEINGVVYKKGEVISNTQLSWTSSDENVAIYEDGKIKAFAIGETTIVARYELDGVEITGICQVEVLAHKANFENYDLDLSDTNVDYCTIPTENFDGSVSLIQLNDGEKIDVPFTIDDNNIKIFKIFLQGHLGVKEVVIHTNTSQYTGKMTIATIVISNKNELKEFEDYTSTGAENSKIDGYFVLDSNIDYEGKKLSLCSHYEDFAGTLDGRGYTIKNVSINVTSGDRGLFGRFVSGTIKNIAFVGLMNTDTSSDTNRILLTMSLKGTVENVYIQATRGNITRKVVGGGAISVVEATGVVKNLVVNITEGTTKETVAVHGSAITGASNYRATIENVIGISSFYKAMDYPTGWANSANYPTVVSYTSISEAQEANVEYSGTVWDTSIWDITGAIPMFKEEQYVQLSNVDIDLSKVDTHVTLYSEIQGTVKEVKIFGENVPFEIADGIKISKTILSGMLGKNDIQIKTDTTNYNGTVTIATMILSDKTELKAFEDYTSTGAENSKIDGYFILDSNIDYEGQKLSLCSHYEDFVGTLDGRGYTIKNVSVNVTSGD